MSCRQFRAVFLLASIALASITATSLRAEVVYSSIPSPLPGNVVSLGYQATSTAEFGDRIQLTTGGVLTNVTVTMSDWAQHSQFPAMSAAGWSHPITLNLYSVGPGDTVGALIHSATVVASIPWHDPIANAPYSGTAFNVDFAIPNVTVPGDLIFSIAYNTQSYGDSPLGVAGPYNSLNVGLHNSNTDGPIAIGTDYDPDSVYWNTSFAGFYTDLGAGGVGIFRLDTNWTPYTIAAEFTVATVPEPGTFVMMGMFLALLGGLMLRRRSIRMAPNLAA